MPFRRRFKCELYTPTDQIASSEALSVKFPATDGQVGVLGGRSPMVAMLGVGKITISPAKGKPIEFFVSRGFAQMSENILSFLAEECMPVASLNAETAWEELQLATKLPAETEAQISIRDDLMATARGKFDIAQKRRRDLGLAGGGIIEE